MISVSVGTGSTGCDSTRDLRCSTGSAGTNVSSCGGGGGGGNTVSGAGTGTLLITPDVMQQMDGFKQEITRLKCDKLDLLRQNVVSRCVLHFSILYSYVNEFSDFMIMISMGKYQIVI